MTNAQLEGRILKQLKRLGLDQPSRDLAKTTAATNLARLTQAEANPIQFNTSRILLPGSDPIEHPDQTIWPIDESPMEGNDPYTLQKEFASVVPEGYTMQTDIQHVLEAKSQRTAVELGGSGNNTFAHFPEGFFDQTIGTVLHNTGIQQNLSHTVLRVNIFSPDGIDTIKQHLPHGKTDCLIQRIGGPLTMEQSRTYPPNLFEVVSIAQQWYELLNEGGVMYMQLPAEISLYMTYYLDYIKANYADTLEITTGKGNYSSNVLRLVKKPNAPTSLPLLSLKTIAQIDLYHEDIVRYGKTAGSMIQAILHNDALPDEQRNVAIEALQTTGFDLFEKPAPNFWGTPEKKRYKDIVDDAANTLDEITSRALDHSRDIFPEEIDLIKSSIQYAIDWNPSQNDQIVDTRKYALRQILNNFDFFLGLYIRIRKNEFRIPISL